jgi:hypothetical protein
MLKFMWMCLAAAALSACAGGTATTVSANPELGGVNDTVEGMTETPDSANPDDAFDDSLGTEM